MFTGTLNKMMTSLSEEVDYYLSLKEDFIHINALIGRVIHLKYTHNECMECKGDLPLFRMGFCKKCFYESPAANESIIKPELSKAHLGIEVRDLEFEKKLELQPHIVYLSISSGLKVGVTRKSQIPTRWIDQGAEKAIILVETPNRYLAGITEVSLKEMVNDKTNWRKMLGGSAPELDLNQEKERLKMFLPEEVIPYVSEDNTVYEINFPTGEYHPKISSVNLEKTPVISKTLRGIKGQYLIFEDASVLNVRNQAGRVVKIKVD